MKMRLSIVLLAVGAALAGCNDANKGQEAKAVGWFLDHRAELATALKECRDNPGKFGTAPNCVNANEARNKITIQEMKDALK
ncbi:EexN family lipoprotein [Bradyrhizobium sp. Leaf401]|uniref:EexN family lipoprotein n=1 Tax=Bradyrhizobium sp. Leaf401 TaxID=2876564 RepID=UPI001E634CED|nr:EexN family lipoprotein [Bradyrhizobium sp. Leaf401]